MPHAPNVWAASAEVIGTDGGEEVHLRTKARPYGLVRFSHHARRRTPPESALRPPASAPAWSARLIALTTATSACECPLGI